MRKNKLLYKTRHYYDFRILLTDYGIGNLRNFAKRFHVSPSRLLYISFQYCTYVLSCYETDDVPISFVDFVECFR